jgi:glycosyltransferase involved in cell wall biosynthesis
MNTPFYYEYCVTRKLPLRKRVEKWEKEVITRADNVYVVSEKLKKMYIERYGVAEKKFTVIPNGFSGALYSDFDKKYNEIRNEKRMEKGLDGRFLVVFVGSLKIWHGIDKFCTLADSLANRDDIRFLVLGDGEERSKIQEYCTTHNNLIFMGKLNYETMKKYLYASDLGIMPYKKDDNFYFSPLKMFDMIGARLPFIGTDEEQIHEVCTTTLSSLFLIPNNAVDTMKKRIVELADNRAELDEMKRQLVKNASLHTWKRRAEYLLHSLN